MTHMSKEYATALFALAMEEDIAKQVLKDLLFIKDIFEKNEDYINILSSPAIHISERLDIVDSAFSTLSEYAVSFLKILCEKGLVHSFLDAVLEYENLFNESINISSATVLSAIELTDDKVEILKQKIEKMCGHTVVIETIVDESLIGGIQIEVDGKVIDASLRSRLSDIKDVISR